MDEPDANAVAPPKVVRGSHAGRTKAMRSRLIQAAVDCLYELGYSGTTFQTVTDRAGVSRGAILHHFPTRVDLMAAVVDHAAAVQDEIVLKAAALNEGGVDMFVSITRATWTATMQPPAMVMLEIMMATRGDPELAARILEVTVALENRQRDNVWLFAESLGITDKRRIYAMVRLHRAAMRGLALELSLTRNQVDSDESMDLLVHYKKLLSDELIPAT